MGKRWTQDEIEILKKYYSEKGRKYCADLLSRTYQTVDVKAFSLGLAKKAASEWTEQEKNLLRQYYPTCGVEYCAHLLHRSHTIIRSRASSLGLRTRFISGRWTMEEVNFLMKYYTKYGSKYCSRGINKSPLAISGKAARLGLSTDIVAYGSPQRRIIKQLDDNKVISLCKIHGKTIHYFRNGKISECIQCHNRYAIKNARTDRGRTSIQKSHQKYRSTPIGKFVCRLRTSLTRIGCFRLLPYSPQELVEHFEKIRLFQNNQCPMCSRSYDINPWTIDHIIPIKTAQNEEDVLRLFVLDNLSLLCKSCNASKGAQILTPDEIKGRRADEFDI